MNTNELKTQIRILTDKIFNASSHNIIVTKENTKKLNEMSQECHLLQEQLEEQTGSRWIPSRNALVLTAWND